MYWFIPPSFPPSPATASLCWSSPIMFTKLILFPLYFWGAKHLVWQTNRFVPFVASRSQWALDGVYELKHRNQGHPSNYERNTRENNEHCSATETHRGEHEGRQLILVQFPTNRPSVSAGNEGYLVCAWDWNKDSFQPLQKSIVIKTCLLSCHLVFDSFLCWTLWARPVQHVSSRLKKGVDASRKGGTSTFLREKADVPS